MTPYGGRFRLPGGCGGDANPRPKARDHDRASPRRPQPPACNPTDFSHPSERKWASATSIRLRSSRPETNVSMITQRRDLHTGRSYWLSRPMPRVPVSTLRRDIDTDVLVVGAGVTGALI